MRKLFAWSLLLISAAGCKEKYVPKLNLTTNSFLVVEGFINSGTGPTTIKLTRTTPVSDTARIVYEKGATVRVEGQNGTSFPLSEISNGIYNVPQLALNSATQYRIYIKTKDGKEYASDYSGVRKTPDMDSVWWKPKDGGVQVYVDTHDPLNKTIYYQWKYNQTWQFQSRYFSTLTIAWDSAGVVGLPRPTVLGVKYKDPLRLGVADSSILICWRSDSSSAINIASSERLTQDVIHEQPLAFLPPNSQQLSILYSIIVYQYALSERAYRFYQQLKKNTEQLGTTFDSQPSDNTGNIRCLGNAKEIVLGFVEVSEEKKRRIFIKPSEVPGWRYVGDCAPEIKVKNDPDFLRTPSPLRGYLAPNFMFTTVADFGGSGTAGIDSVYVAERRCVDCTLTGTNKKPAFWP
jgi:hypothetical protein